MKRLLILFLALVMLLGILAGCQKATKTQAETVPPTTETTAPAEASTTPTETSTTNGEPVENTLHVTPSQFTGALLDFHNSSNLFDCQGYYIRPLPSNLSHVDNDIALIMCNSMLHSMQYAPCTLEDFQQAGVNFAYLLVHMSDSEVLDTLKEISYECFTIAKAAYSMDHIYPWILVGMVCPDILPEFFSGQFSETPDPLVIEEVQEWIPDILYLQESTELVEAIRKNPWFELEYLPAEEG